MRIRAEVVDKGAKWDNENTGQYILLEVRSTEKNIDKFVKLHIGEKVEIVSNRRA